MLNATATVSCPSTSPQTVRVQVWFGPPAIPTLVSTGDICYYEPGNPGQGAGFQELLLGQDMGGADPGFRFEIFNSIGQLVESGFKPDAGSA